MPSQITNYQCPSCTGPLRFDGASGKLQCDYCGRSFTIAEIEKIYQDKLEEAEIAQSYRFCPDGEVGAVSMKLYNRITGIQFGELEDTHGWCYYI